MTPTDIRANARELKRKHKKVLVCGSRHMMYGMITKQEVFDQLDELKNTYFKDNYITIITGWADGIDLTATEWAEKNKLPFYSFPADWDKHSKLAGPIRNYNMLLISEPDVVVVFPGQTGTKNMRAIAKAEGIEIIDMNTEEPPWELTEDEKEKIKKEIV